MAVERAASNDVKVAMNWVHSMNARMANCLAGKMVLMRVSSAGGQMAVRGGS